MGKINYYQTKTLLHANWVKNIRWIIFRNIVYLWLWSKGRPFKYIFKISILMSMLIFMVYKIPCYIGPHHAETTLFDIDLLLLIFDECCARSIHQGQGQVITSHSTYGTWLLVPALDTCFWHSTNQYKHKILCFKDNFVCITYTWISGDHLWVHIIERCRSCTTYNSKCHVVIVLSSTCFILLPNCGVPAKGVAPTIKIQLPSSL